MLSPLRDASYVLFHHFDVPLQNLSPVSYKFINTGSVKLMSLSSPESTTAPSFASIPNSSAAPLGPSLIPLSPPPDSSARASDLPDLDPSFLSDDHSALLDHLLTCQDLVSLQSALCFLLLLPGRLLKMIR